MAKVIGETVSDGYKVIFNPTNLLTWSVLAKTMFCLKSYLQSVTCTMPKASFPMETHSTGMFWNSIKWYELQVPLCAAVVVSPPLSSSYYLPVFIVSSRLFFVVTLTGNLSFLIIKNLEAEIMIQIVGGVILNLKNKQEKKTKKKTDLRSCLLEEMLKTIPLQQPPLPLIHNHLHSVPFWSICCNCTRKSSVSCIVSTASMSQFMPYPQMYTVHFYLCSAKTQQQSPKGALYCKVKTLQYYGENRKPQRWFLSPLWQWERKTPF